MSSELEQAQDSQELRPCSGDHVVVVGDHPWRTYKGEVIGIWPRFDYDWLVELENGQLIRVDDENLRRLSA